jgi:serine/threonine protein phosphatase PrpC
VRASYAIGSRESFTAAVVCDGLGGMSQGREAAILGASAFTAQLFCSPIVNWETRLSRAVTYANSQVYQRLRGNGGTTLSAVISSHGGAMLCHVGDSRIYGIMPDRALEQLSRDDTINALLKRHEGDAEAPKDSRLLQFVGMGDEMEAQIATVPGRFRSVLLTSDGAHDVPHSVFQRVITAAAGGNDLIRKLLTLSDLMGGRDNASAILLPIGSEAEFHDESGENELLAILPNDTLVICITGSDAWERPGRARNPPPDYPPREASKRIEDAPASEMTVDNKQELKPASPKRKGRTTEARKPKQRPAPPKADAADRLPLDEPSNEVDVQFSTPANRLDEDKQ